VVGLYQILNFVYDPGMNKHVTRLKIPKQILFEDLYCIYGFEERIKNTKNHIKKKQFETLQVSHFQVILDNYPPEFGALPCRTTP
jgi:hypothetical protein